MVNRSAMALSGVATGRWKSPAIVTLAAAVVALTAPTADAAARQTRAAQPAELAPAYVFLASNESRFVTGEVYGATGGKTPY